MGVVAPGEKKIRGLSSGGSITKPAWICKHTNTEAQHRHQKQV